jgi:hypothetical protein
MSLRNYAASLLLVLLADVPASVYGETTPDKVKQNCVYEALAPGSIPVPKEFTAASGGTVNIKRYLEAGKGGGSSISV